MKKTLRVTIDGKLYQVAVEMPDEPKPATASAVPAAPTAAAPVENTPAPASTSSAHQPGDIVSPLAGRVVSIGAQVGQDVKEGDNVLTLEAMKMNTFVFAPKAGKIKEVKTTVGASVMEGQVLLVME